MAMVWPCGLSVDSYVQAGRAIEFPRPECPSCAVAMSSWSGYWRHVRQGGVCQRIFIARVRCRCCAVTHAMLPAFVLAGRLDAVEVIGAVVEEVVVAGPGGVRPAAERAGVPHTTARGWCRRFRAGSTGVAVAFAALAVELGGVAMTPTRSVADWALAAIGAAWQAAVGLPGWAALGCWRFASAVSGGKLIALNTDSPWLIVGRRRFMPPVP